MRFPKRTRAERQRICALMRAARERNRLAGPPPDPEPQRVPPGDYLGALTWHAADGSVRRYLIRQGPRANNIAVTACVAGSDAQPRVMGWDRLMAGLRKRLSIPKRVSSSPP